MSDVLFSIARDFSPHPGPRFVRQGANSGEALRKRLIALLDQANDTVVVDLDGTKGIGSSFLDEAFGGLIRTEGKSKADVLNRFKFQSRIDPSYVETILDSINRAASEPATVH
jgi:hypothetical protein